MLWSLVRTYVPLALGVLFTWLASLGIDVSESDRVTLSAGIGALVAAVYYALARALERKWPALTILLGSPAQPAVYTNGDPAVVQQAVNPRTTGADD